MFKQFEIRESMEKTLTKLVRNFNDILTRNGQKPIIPIRLYSKDIECRVIYRDAYKKNMDYTVPGAVYSIDIPDNVLSIDGHMPIGKYTKQDGVWIRHMISNLPDDEKDVCEANFRCDHCGKKIARNGYWFFRKVDGTLVVVGSSCVQKYFGINPDELLKELGKLVEFVEHVSCSADYYDRNDFFGKNAVARISNEVCYALVKYLTKDFSAWHKKDDDGNGTAQRIKGIMYDLFSIEPDYANVQSYHEARNAMTDEDKKNIEFARLYWKIDKNMDDFSVNTRSLIDAGNFPIYLSGYVAYGFFKAVKSFRNAKNSTHNGDFVGTPKQRMDKVLIARKSTRYERESYFGYGIQHCSRLQFEDENGNVYISFASSQDTISKAEENMNKAVNYRFTISEHRTEKNGNKTNVITRVV